MTSPFPPTVRPSFPAARTINLVGAAVLIAGFFLPWYVSRAASGTTSLRGFELGGFTPEVFLLPAIGLVLAIGSVLQWSGARFPDGSRILVVGTLGLGFVALAVLIEGGVRFDPDALTLFGASFWNAVGLGWYVSVLGAALVLAAGAFELVSHRDRGARAA